MIVNISEIRRVLGGVLEVPVHLSPKSVEGLDLEAPVRGWVRLENMGPRFYLTGEVSTVVRLDCVRCAGSFSRPLSVEIDEFYAPSFSHGRGDEEQVLDDLNVFSLHGDELDLSDPIRENLLLAIPITTLCRPDCQGICPICGSNRNEDVCTCSSEQP
jgi:uncharacterized protein